jgi:hypothetical protein
MRSWYWDLIPSAPHIPGSHTSRDLSHPYITCTFIIGYAAILGTKCMLWGWRTKPNAMGPDAVDAMGCVRGSSIHSAFSSDKVDIMLIVGLKWRLLALLQDAYIELAIWSLKRLL